MSSRTAPHWLRACRLRMWYVASLLRACRSLTLNLDPKLRAGNAPLSESDLAEIPHFATFLDVLEKDAQAQ
jgi:hypothetical protein